MKALVTGANGFVGPYLIRELRSAGHDVCATYLSGRNIPLIRSFQMDIMDNNKVRHVFNDFQPDTIFHLAGISNVKFSRDNPEKTIRINTEGSKNIIDCAGEINATVVLIGSAEEYGIPEFLPITEEHSLNPNSAYGVSKVISEEYARNSLDTKVIILRPFNHIGPGQRESFVCSAFAKQIARIEKGISKSEIYVGNLDAERDFTDVRDVVRAYVLASKFCAPGEPYNICSGKGIKIEAILNCLLKLSRKEIKITQDPSRMREIDNPTIVGDCTKFKRDSGWNPTIEIEGSLLDILNYWRENL